jgi:hypothetical protein
MEVPIRHSCSNFINSLGSNQILFKFKPRSSLNFYSKSISNLKKFLYRKFFLSLNPSKPFFSKFSELEKIMFGSNEV